MDSPNTGQSVKLLTTNGTGSFFESEYTLPPLQDLDIRVQTVFTGVCRSDIDMMNGNFPLLPKQMNENEGLVIVVNRGIGVKDNDCKIGDM